MLPTGGAGSKDPLPDYMKMFGQVFSEEGFAKLPRRKPWDHAIEFTPGAQPKGCKVYPLSVKEQAELDAFLTGKPRDWSHPSIEISYGFPCVLH
jgi:hypothetical protein